MGSRPVPRQSVDGGRWIQTSFRDGGGRLRTPIHVLWEVTAEKSHPYPVPKIEDPNLLPVCVSVSGVNLAYSPQDKAEYLLADGYINVPKVFRRMSQISYLMFQAMEHYRVAIPVMSAIGCGAFRGDAPNREVVPELWATAMVRTLSSYAFHFRCVLISLPEFGDQNMAAFAAVFRRHAHRLPVPVLLSKRHGLVSLALAVARHLDRDPFRPTRVPTSRCAAASSTPRTLWPSAPAALACTGVPVAMPPWRRSCSPRRRSSPSTAT